MGQDREADLRVGRSGGVRDGRRVMKGNKAILKRQSTRILFKIRYEALKSKNPQTRLQINNLRFAHNAVFDWLDTLFEWNQIR